MEETSGDDSFWPAWPAPGKREASSLSLQDARRETWIGLPVVIVRGKVPGLLARVLGTGSGWVQVRVAPEDGSDPMLSDESTEVSKRAVDLHVVKGYEDPDKIPMAPVSDAAKVKEEGDEDDSQEEIAIHVGDSVRVVEGSFEGKTGKVITASRATVTLSMKNASSVVVKRRNEVELVSPRKNKVTADTETQEDSSTDKLDGAGVEEGEGAIDRKGASDKVADKAGRSSRLTARRMEMLNKRVQIITTAQIGVVTRIAPNGSLVITLDEDESDVTKRREEIQLVTEEDETMSQDAPGDNDVEEPAPEDVAVKRTRHADRPARSSPKTVHDRSNAAARRRANQQAREAAGPSTRTGARRQVRRTTRNGAAIRRQKEMSAEEYSMSQLTAAKRIKQEFMGGFVMRQHDKMARSMGMAKRPDLTEYLSLIQGPDDDNEVTDEDAFVPMLYDPPMCSTCRLEMEKGDLFCWNPACFSSPIYQGGAIPITDEALPIKLRDRFSSLAQSPRKPGFIDYSALNGAIKKNLTVLALDNEANKTDEQRKDEARLGTEEQVFFPRFKTNQNDIIFSPLVSYSLRAKSIWLGQAPTIGEVGYFGPGWKEGLVLDEPGLPGADQADKKDVALDFRWKRGLVV